MAAFLKKLDQEQRINAGKIVEAAQAAGIDPLFAVGLAYQESKLRTNVPRGKKGEYGLMQVMPSTGADIGYSPADLADQDKNIEAGIKYLKKCLDATGNSPALAAACYNGGPDTFNQLVQTQEINPNAISYVRKLQKLGVVPYYKTQNVQQESGAANQSPENKTTASEPSENKSVASAPVQQPSPEDLQAAANERMLAGLLGGAAGTSIAAGRGAFDVGKNLIGAASSRMQKPAAPAAPSFAPQGVEPTPLKVPPTGGGLTGGLPTGAIQPEGYGTLNWGVSEMNVPRSAVERAHAVAPTKGELHAGLQRQGTLLGPNTPDMPPFARGAVHTAGSEIFTPATQAPEVDRYLAERQRAAAEEARLNAERMADRKRILDARAAQSAAAEAAANAPKVSPLQAITQRIGQLADTPVVKGVSRYLGPVGGLGMAGMDATRMYQESQKPNPDYAKMGLAGASALAGAAGVFPPLAIPGAAVSLGISGLDALYDRYLDQQRKENPAYVQP